MILAVLKISFLINVNVYTHALNSNLKIALTFLRWIIVSLLQEYKKNIIMLK